MRKGTSFILSLILAALFMNTMLSYYLWFGEEKEQAWVNSLNEIPNSEYKVIKVNASLYSFIEDTEFEPVNENIEIKGVVYHVFKKKTKDNITSFYYLKNKQQSSFDINLKKITNDSDFMDLLVNKKPLAKLLKSLIKDYVFKYQSDPVFVYKTILQKSKQIRNLEKPILNGYTFDCFIPPKLV